VSIDLNLEPSSVRTKVEDYKSVRDLISSLVLTPVSNNLSIHTCTLATVAGACFVEEL